MFLKYTKYFKIAKIYIYFLYNATIEQLCESFFCILCCELICQIFYNHDLTSHLSCVNAQRCRTRAEEEEGRAHARARSGMNTNVEDGGGGRWEGGERT